MGKVTESDRAFAAKNIETMSYKDHREQSRGLTKSQANSVFRNQKKKAGKYFGKSNKKW